MNMKDCLFCLVFFSVQITASVQFSFVKCVFNCSRRIKLMHPTYIISFTQIVGLNLPINVSILFPGLYTIEKTTQYNALCRVVTHCCHYTLQWSCFRLLPIFTHSFQKTKFQKHKGLHNDCTMYNISIPWQALSIRIVNELGSASNLHMQNKQFISFKPHTFQRCTFHSSMQGTMKRVQATLPLVDPAIRDFQTSTSSRRIVF